MPLSLKQWCGAAAIAVAFGVVIGKYVNHHMASGFLSLEPEADPGPKAILNYLGPGVPVDVHYKYADGRETIDLVSFGQDFEHEEYLKTAHSFALVNAAGDKFDPPLPLLTDNGQTTWSGKDVSGGVAHEAKASVALSQGSVKSTPVDLKATVATVQLSIDSGSPTPAKRILKFYFVKGRGVIQREFGQGVTRQPDDR